MRKKIGSTFTKVLYGVFIITTIIMLFIAYKDVGGSLAFKFGIAYMLLVFFMLIYTPLITIINLRHFNWKQRCKRIVRFIAIFIYIGSLNFILDYIFRPSKIDLLREFSGAFGIAFALAFMDVIIFKNKDN